MLLTLRNLPPSMRYPDVKALIQSNCGSMQVILDNLVQNNEYKMVTVGLADDADAAIFRRKMNGLFVDGCQLYVEDSRQKKTVEQPYYPMHYGVAPEIPTMLPTNLPSSVMPQMPMDPNMAQYGMYNMNMQNPAMLYHQQFMPVMPTGQFPVEPQAPYVDNRNQSDNRQQSNVRDSYESRDRPDHDWDKGPVTQQSRHDIYSTNRDEPQRRSPKRNIRDPKYDHRESDNIQKPHENISYPLHLYSRPNVPPSSKPNTRPDVVTGNYDNPNESPFYSQNIQTEYSRDRMSENSSNIRRETRDRPGFSQDPPLGFNPEPKRGSQFEDNHGGKRARYDQNPYRRPGFDRESPQRSSESRHERESRPRTRNNKKSNSSRPRLDQDPNNKRAFDNDPPNIRPGGNARSGFDRDSNYSNNRGNRQPESSKDRYFDQSASSSIRPRDKPWSIFQGSGANTEHRNQTFNVTKPNDSGRSNVQPNESNVRTVPKKSRPNFGEDFIPVGGGTSTYPPPRAVARQDHRANPVGGGPSTYPPPRAVGPRQNSRANPAQIFKAQVLSNKNNEPRLNLVGNNSQPNNNAPDDVSPAMKQAMNVHNNTIFQTAAAIARDIMRGLELEKQEKRVMLKPLKKAIRARFDLLLGDNLVNSPMLAEQMYRRKYPVNKDHEFFEEVLQNLEKGGPNDTEDAAEKPQPKKQEKVQTKRPDILNIASITAVKDGNVPKYPNADKKIMKQQKQLGKQEYLNEDFYELPELIKNALEQELDELCNIFINECGQAENQTEKTVTERVIETSLPDFRRSVKLNVTKRILNVNTNLIVRIYFYGKQPKLPELNELLRPYGVVSCRKSVKAPIFLANVDSIDNYDRLLALANAKLGDTSLTIKPLQVTGYKVRPNVRRGKKGKRQVQPECSNIETNVTKPEITNKVNVTETVSNFNVTKTETVNKPIIKKENVTPQKPVRQVGSQQINVKQENVKKETCNEQKVNKEPSNEEFNDVDISNFAEDDLEDY